MPWSRRPSNSPTRAGIGALTMRAVALNSVDPMATYTYVPGKAELIDLMVDKVYGEM